MSDDLKLKIDAHVIRQLGAELITSPIVAITELIKNSHDADAKWCKLEIDTEYSEEFEVAPALYPDDKSVRLEDYEVEENGKVVIKQKGFKTFKGKISVSDDGLGMERDVINKSWLTVSYSEKRLKKSQGEKTGKERNYTGDKGLGRLGTMQVASICNIQTSTSSSHNNIKITINWDQLIEGITLDQIRITESTLPKEHPKAKGTTIELIGLTDMDYWSNNLSTFKYEVATYISPFGFFAKRKDSFEFYIKIHGIEEDAKALTDNLINLHAGRYEFGFNGNNLVVKGKLSLSIFNPKEGPDFKAYILPDKGNQLYSYFKKSKELGTFNVERAEKDDAKYYLCWTKEIDFDELFSAEKYKKLSPENPGEFNSEIFEYIYSKESIGSGPEGIGFAKSKELIQVYLRGINLYRDGFKIGSGREDWFNLNYEKTGGESYYSLRLSNIAGYVDISWDKNPKLIDTSNREGLVANSAYTAFLEICLRAVNEINNFKNHSRRLTLKFLDEKKREDYDKPKNYSPEQAISDLKALSSNAESIYLDIKQKKINVDQKFQSQSLSLKENIQNSINIFTDPNHLHLLNELRNQLLSLQDLYSSLEPSIEKTAHELASSVAMVNVIFNQIEDYKQQINSFYGHVSIGLSAQFLAHDVNSQISNITRSNQNIKNRFKLLNIKDVEISKATIAIDGHTQALSKAVSALNPLVQAQRETKHQFTITEGVSSYVDYISDYLENDGINISLEIRSSKAIKFNHGKFYQVLDNIIRNSQYWLNSFGKHHPQIPKTIYILIEDYQLTIWDTGKGVRPGIEDSMFDMFVTDKPDGQGIGLFIVKTLLNERSCLIYLSDEKNKFGRKYKFQIDFSGAAV